MRRLITIIIIILTAASACGAKDLTRFLLRGYIYDSEYNTIDSVGVSLSRDNDSIPLRYKVLTGNDEERLLTGGQMRLMVEAGLGSYTLVLEKEGLEPLIRTFRIASVGEEVKYLGALVMEQERHRTLGEVTVTATRLKMVMKGDTIEYDAGAFSLSEGSMLDALVRQLPGATIDADGVITVNGRKIKELLINGKDFFKGEPKVALRNLPAYTVKNVQVYDKRADDANITHSDARIDTREDEQNLVMDVNLRKEYQTGWMANAEAGGGTADRYRARAFGLGYTDRFRLAAFANANNVGDTDKASASGEWGGGWGEDGMLNVRMGGVDYNYDNSDKIKAGGSVTLTHENVHYENEVSTVQFYPTGDLYKRSLSLQAERKRHFMTSHDFTYRGDNVFVYVRPSVDWLVRNRGYDTRSDMYDSDPDTSTDPDAGLMTALRTLRAQHDNWLDLSVNATVRIRPASWHGYLTVAGYGTYYDSPLRERALYRQTAGPAGTAGQADSESDRYHTTSARRRNLSGTVTYTYQKNFYTDRISRELSFSVRATYGYDNRRSDTEYFVSDTVGPMHLLPAIVTPADARRDLENTRYAEPTTRNTGVTVNVGYTRQPLAPGDSAFNATVAVGLGAAYTHRDEKLTYIKPTIMDETVSRTSDLLSPQLYFSLSSANRRRYMQLYVMGHVSSTTPSLTYLLATTDNSDPFNVWIGNPGGLRNETDYQGSVSLSRYSRRAHHASVFWDAHVNVSRNSVEMSRVYDPATGVTVSQPVNVNGRWSSDSRLQYNIQAGPREQVDLAASVYGRYEHIIDYNAIMAAPERNTVHSGRIEGRVNTTYRFRQGSTVAFHFVKGWNLVRSPRETFTDLNTHTYNFSLRASLQLPWQLEASSSLTFGMRRGYSDREMNTDEWLWNASASKSLLSGRLSLRLTAYDILRSVRNVTQSVTSVGRVETRRLTLPRYVMLSASWRFDMKPRASAGKSAD